MKDNKLTIAVQDCVTIIYDEPHKLGGGRVHMRASSAQARQWLNTYGEEWGFRNVPDFPHHVVTTPFEDARQAQGLARLISDDLHIPIVTNDEFSTIFMLAHVKFSPESGEPVSPKIEVHAVTTTVSGVRAMYGQGDDDHALIVNRLCDEIERLEQELSEYKGRLFTKAVEESIGRRLGRANDVLAPTGLRILADGSVVSTVLSDAQMSFNASVRDDVKRDILTGLMAEAKNANQEKSDLVIDVANLRDQLSKAKRVNVSIERYNAAVEQSEKLIGHLRGRLQETIENAQASYERAQRCEGQAKRAEQEALDVLAWSKELQTEIIDLKAALLLAESERDLARAKFDVLKGSLGERLTRDLQ